MTAKDKAERLAQELREVLGWALTEKKPLREIEIESIRKALQETGFPARPLY